VERQPRLIFLRPALNRRDGFGVIHISDDLAGSNVVQVTPADVRASFVGLSEQDGAAILYYLAARETSSDLTLEARDLGTGATTTLASVQIATAGSIRPDLTVPPSGSLSPDGRYVALTHRDGLDLLDLTTNGRQNILPEACQSRPGNCVFYRNSTWSPDGRLLLVWTQGAFEGSELRIVDPFQQPAQITSMGFMAGAWSPAGDALCGWGVWDTGSGLCLSEAPQWRDTRGLVPESEAGCPSADIPGSAVSGCVWLDEHRIAFLSGGVSIYDLETAAVTEVADLGGASTSVELSAVPGTSTIVFIDWDGGQPGLLDTTDGTSTPILQPGDWVVAVTQPVALPEEVVAAKPEVGPCAPVTTDCEAQVTNVAPNQLSARKWASQLTDVTGGLSEGETVCVTGPSRLGADGYWWWPVSSQNGVEGWVAHGDPQQPERRWLALTGRKCAPKTPELAPGWTKIEPGGDTICAKGTPYAYFVHPGTVNRLVVVFDGGDICWSDATCSLLNPSYITVDDSDNPRRRTAGIFDLDNPNNPFRDWFWVSVPYCTADLHWGNSTWTYHWGGTDTVIHHKGFVNVTAVLGWIKDNFEQPEKIFVWGGSAGSGGAILHAAYIQELYPDVPLYELGDSGAGVIAEDLLESGFPNWGSRENLLNWIPALQVPLSQLTMAKLYIALANYYANTRWAQYNTAHDMIQAISYAATGGSSADWSQLMLASIQEIQDNAANFHSYIAPGALHTIAWSDTFYTREVNGVRFRDWVDAMVNDEAWDDVMCTDCETDPGAQ